MSDSEEEMYVPEEVEIDHTEQRAAAVLQKTLQGLLADWTTPRTRRDWSVAMWRPEQKMAELLLNKHKLFDRMGIMRRKARLLHIEEAVYMVARSNLMLVMADDSGKPNKLLSVQESYELMLEAGMPMAQFQMYSHLSRVGYILFRHGSDSSPATKAKAQKSQPQPQQHAQQTDDDNDVSRPITDRLPRLTGLRAAELRDLDDGPAYPLIYDIYRPDKTFGRKDANQPDFRVCMAGEMLPSAGSLARTQAQSGSVPVLYAIVDHGDVDFFSPSEPCVEDVWTSNTF